MTYDVIIIGGGLTGLQMALSLGSYDLRVAVVDKAPLSDVTNADFDGRTCAISYASANLMKKTGVWEHLIAHASPMYNIDIEDGDIVRGKSPFSVHFDCDIVGGEPLGYIVENNITRSTQYTVLSKMKNVDYFAEKSIKNIHRDDKGVQVFLNEGIELKAKLIVGCDGRNSQVRKNANIDTVGWKYDQMGIVCTIDIERQHKGLAVELFLPSGPFALLPMTDNRMSVVWSEKSHIAKDLLGVSEQDFLYHLQQRVGKKFGEIKVVEDKRYVYPMSLMHAKTYIGTRLALVGDSAHGMHPIAGQGLNLGFRDVAALVECVVLAHRRGDDIGKESVLKEYEQYRYADATALLTITDFLTRLFSNNNGFLKAGRVLGLGLVNKVNPLKKLFMMHAMGRSGTHIPRLLKGKDLLD